MSATIKIENNGWYRLAGSSVQITRTTWGCPLRERFFYHQSKGFGVGFFTFDHQQTSDPVCQRGTLLYRPTSGSLGWGFVPVINVTNIVFQLAMVLNHPSANLCRPGPFLNQSVTVE